MWIFLFFALAACNDRPGSDGPPPRPPGRAQVSIKQQDTVLGTTKFENLSASDFLECHLVNGLFEIKAKRRVDPQQPGIEHDFNFFFLDSEDIEQGRPARWSGFPSIVTGKMLNDKTKSLSGKPGKCSAKLHRAGNVLTGDIFCTDFANDDLGPFDFDISNLLCTLT